MPKIRGVKPDYWTDEDIVDLTIPARLLFIGLWNYACDNGHLQDKPKQIKMRIFPGDSVNATKLLEELATKKRILRGQGWITIPNLTEHQHIDVRYFTTCDKEGCDDPPEKVSQRESRRAHKGARRVHAGALGDGDGDGELMVKDAKAPTTTKRATALPSDFAPSDKHQALAADLRVDIKRELTKFSDHHRAKGSTFKDWNAAFNNWIRRAAEYAGKVTPLPQRTDDQGRLVLPPLPKGVFDQ